MQVVCVLLLYRGGVGVPVVARAVVTVQLVRWCRWRVYDSILLIILIGAIY